MRIEEIATQVAQWEGVIEPKIGVWFPDERRWGSEYDERRDSEEGRAAVKFYAVRCHDVSVATIYMDGDGNVTGLSFRAQPANLAVALHGLFAEATRG